MKIEIINKENIDDFIKDLKLNDDNSIKEYKNELFGLKIDETFYLGFISLTNNDYIGILYCNPKMSKNLFLECISFLKNNIVVENHLVVMLYENKYMKYLEDNYKCKEVYMSKSINECEINKNNIYDITSDKQKYIDIDMNSIKYYVNKNMIVCDLLKQNIVDENTICELNNSFNNTKYNVINFIINEDLIECLKKLDYECTAKSYLIRNNL